jgi:hypothetical protein
MGVIVYEIGAGPDPLFYVGSSPSMAAAIVNQEAGTAGVMVSMVALRRRKSNFAVGDWILDSGAFTEIARSGGFSHGPEEYIGRILRWSRCGNLLTAVTQDWMCEPFVLARTGLSVAEHQRLTVERYDILINLAQDCQLATPIMPVLQGYTVSDYLACLQLYGDRLRLGAWVGVGSVCRRNSDPDQVADILRAIKLVRSDLRLHGFGLKQTALGHPVVRDLLYSADSTAWSYPKRYMSDAERAAVDDVQMSHEYQERTAAVVRGDYQRAVPATAGAGNRQGRKPKWKSGRTVPIRVPECFAGRLLALAEEWDGGTAVE